MFSFIFVLYIKDVSFFGLVRLNLDFFFSFVFGGMFCSFLDVIFVIGLVFLRNFGVL